jgi:predicted N-formylglutamate amidohydrolase
MIIIEIRRDTYVDKSAAIEQWGQALAALIASIQAR